MTREQFATALQVIGEPDDTINQFLPAGSAGQFIAEEEELLKAFLAAAATPEQRQTLSKAAGCAYEELTNWVIRADLKRIKGVSAETAKLLAEAGVKGVRDLAACMENEQRRNKLKDSVKNHLQKPELEKFAAASRKLAPSVITDVSVILVVKGAGLQKPEETLDVFVNGFWPAVKSVDPKATLSKRRDIFPPGYSPSAYDKEPLNQVTEICSGERRIWLKEPNWEAALVGANPLSSLFKEWRMATYSFGRGLHELFFNPDSREPQTNLWQYYIAFLAMYGALFAHIGLTAFGPELARWLSTGNFSFSSGVGAFGLWLVVGIVLVFILSILPAIETCYRQKVYRKHGRLEALPGAWDWIVLPLIAMFLYSPGSYVMTILFWVTLELALLRARAMAWPYRKIHNSDSWIDDYYSVEGDIDRRTGEPKIYKWSHNLLKGFLRRAYTLIYRYIVILSLPITFLGLTIARILQWTRVLGDLGNGLEKALSLILSGVLGDVVTYAMDPAQAHRVRSIVEADLKFFHDRPEVSHIHVFAHSQGTPITFEVLFNQLPDNYRKKIKTYATIGSVLSYYNQANPILDRSYTPRFPERPYPTFADGFKWMNFWNLIDPITEFYGLDEYNLIKEAYKLQPGQDPKLVPVDELRNKVKRDPASPTNIKTRATAENHGEYWGNQEQVQIPLALRVLGLWRPSQWEPQQLLKPPFGLAHYYYVLLLWIAWAVPFLLLFFADVIISLWLMIHPAVQKLTDLIPSAFESLTKPQEGFLGDFLATLASFAQALTLKYTIELIPIAVTLAILLALLSVGLIVSHLSSIARYIKVLQSKT